MSVGIKGFSLVDVEVDAGRSLHVTRKPPHLGANGAYRVCATTGLLTGVAAATATAGHLFAARWTHVTKLALITKMRAKWWTVAGFTAAQEVGLDAIIGRGYTSNWSSGTGLTLTGNSMKKRLSHGTTTFTDIRIATTGALTAGATGALDPHPIAQSGFSELAAAPTVPKGLFALDVIEEVDIGHPQILSQNDVLLVRNSILMGAGGTARVAIEMDWLEVDSF